MSKTQHTPGPWKINNTRMVGEDGRFICHLEGMDPTHSAECKANVRLIVASPELLNALELVDKELQRLDYDPENSTRMAVLAAIAKAKEDGA